GLGATAGAAGAAGAAADEPLPAARRALGAASAASATLVSAAPTVRRFTFSTTTALVRPWLKLWRTTPCSTPRLSVSVLVGATLRVFSPGFFSVIQRPICAGRMSCKTPTLPRFQALSLCARPMPGMFRGPLGPAALHHSRAPDRRPESVRGGDS